MALKSVAKGRIVITDLTDSRQLIAYLSSSNRRQVIYNPDTDEYLPNYATINNVISPELYLSGSTLNKIEDAVSVTWSVQTNSMGAFTVVVANQYYAFGSKHALVIKDNILKDNLSMLYKVDIVYHDAQLNKDILIQTDIEIVKLTNGSNGKGEDAVVALLTNDLQTISTDFQGANGDFTDVESTMTVYEGVVNKTNDWTITFKPSTGVTGEAVTSAVDLYDEALATANYLGDGGTIMDAVEDTKLSPHISITRTTPYVYQQKYTNRQNWSTPSYTYWAFYDSNSTFISLVTKYGSSNIPIGDSITQIYTISPADIPTNAVTIRIGGNLQLEGASFKEVIIGANTYSVKGLTVDSGYVDFTATKEGKSLTKRFSVSKVKAGNSSYLWVRYSQSADGTGMTTNPVDTQYIGTTTTTTATPPTIPSAYQWVKFVGEQGIGVPGADGTSSYLHIKHSNDGGLTFTANNGETFGDYIGKLVDSTIADSSVPSDYQWGKVTGEDATNYKLLVSPKVVKQDKLGVLNATSFTATGKSQTGTETLTNYAGRFTIEEDVGSGLVLKYTSVGNELSKAYAVSTTTRSIRVRLYLAGGTNTILDEETLTVVTDGATGIDAVLLVVSTPDGDVIRNSLGNLRATAELYEGIKTVTATAYQWYARNPAGAGDSDSGTGWNKLSTGTAGGTTGFTTKTLTITPSAIAGSATFMVIVTYAGVKLRREVTVQDITDTYTFATIGNGNFKNGQGSNIFTQKVYQEGLEVDTAGTKFQYQWNLYNNDGTMNTSFVKVGKTITLLASEYVGKGFLYCTVSG